MTLTEHKAKLLEKRAISEQSMKNLRAKKEARRGDDLVGAYVDRELFKHQTIINDIDADLKAAGVTR